MGNGVKVEKKKNIPLAERVARLKVRKAGKNFYSRSLKHRGQRAW